MNTTPKKQNKEDKIVRDWKEPESTVYLSASWATMLTSPSNREAMAEPRSLRKRDSHTRQNCSPHSPRLHQGAWNEPATQRRGFVCKGTTKWHL